MVKLSLRLLGMTLLFSGGVMAQQKTPSPENWTLIKDSETGLEAYFPHFPLEMTFEIPFQNTPPTGYIHLYSVPTQTGVFVLSIFKSSDSNLRLQKEIFKDFFEHQLVPRLFYYPHVFQEQQVFSYNPQGEKEAFFTFEYQDHGVEKRLEGKTILSDQTLYTYFYLSTKEDFNKEELQYFLNSVHLPKLLTQD